jgi:hypothetical protein
MIGDYECHITMMAKDDLQTVAIENLVHAIGWSFSKIDGDPLLGPGVKCYATTHYADIVAEEEVILRLGMTVGELTKNGCEVVRCKVEKIVFDRRFS